MRRRCYLTICLLAVVTLVVSNLSIGGVRELSESEELRVRVIVSAFETDVKWAEGLLQDLAEKHPELAAIVVLELAKANPEVALMVIADLAKANPEVAVRALVIIAITSTELVKTKPKMAKSLQAVLTEAVVQMVDKTPQVAATVVVSIELAVKKGEVSSEIGVNVREEVIAAGLKKSYLTAASPIRP